MRDCSKSRGGFDRVLMAVAATFLTVSATSALAQAIRRAASAAELAIEAAIPRPEPANVPPPTVDDFKLDTTASVPPSRSSCRRREPNADPKPVETKPVDAKPADAATAPAAPTEAPKTDDRAATRRRGDRACDRRAAPAGRAGQGREQRSAADQPVADKLRTCSAPRPRAISTARASAPRSRNSTPRATTRRCGPQAGSLTASAKGVIARLKDAASDGLNAADYPVPDFAAATTPDALADAELKLTASMLDYARQAQSGRMHWSQVSADILYPEHPTDPAEVLANVTTAQGRLRGARQLQPAAQALQGAEGEARRTARPGRRPGDQIADGPALKYTPAAQEAGRQS